MQTWVNNLILGWTLLWQRSRALSFVHMIQVRSLQRTESSQGREEPVARALLKIVGTLLQRKDLTLARVDNLNYREVVGKTWGKPLFVFKMGPRSWDQLNTCEMFVA